MAFTNQSTDLGGLSKKLEGLPSSRKKEGKELVHFIMSARRTDRGNKVEVDTEQPDRNVESLFNTITQSLGTSSDDTPPDHEHLEDESEPQETYQWLDRRTLTKEDIDITRATYENLRAVQDYSDIEWSATTIGAVWTNFISKLNDTIKRLPADARVAVAGCGTFRDLVLLALLNKDIQVTGFDRSPTMLQVGIEMLGFSDEDTGIKLDSEAFTKFMEINGDALSEAMKWAHFLNLVKALVEGEFQEAWIIQGLSELQQAAERLSSGTTNSQAIFQAIMENTDFQDVLMEGVRDRVALTVADLQDENLVERVVSTDPEQRKYSFVMASSVLTHVPKEELFPAIDNLTNLLNDEPDATLYLDLRIDAQEFYFEEGAGRVFRDTLLGGERYFETLRYGEVGLVLKHLDDQGFYATYSWQSSHPDEQKPGSIHFIIKRRPKKRTA